MARRPAYAAFSETFFHAEIPYESTSRFVSPLARLGRPRIRRWAGGSFEGQISRLLTPDQCDGVRQLRSHAKRRRQFVCLIHYGFDSWNLRSGDLKRPSFLDRAYEPPQSHFTIMNGYPRPRSWAKGQ